MLLDLASGSLLHLLPHRLAQPRTVAAFLAHLHPDDGAALGVGGQLHIHRRIKSPVGHLHPPRLRIGSAHPRLSLPDLLSMLALARPPLRFLLLPLQFRQLRNRCLQPLLLLDGSPLARRRLPRCQPRVLGRVHLAPTPPRAAGLPTAVAATALPAGNCPPRH